MQVMNINYMGYFVRHDETDKINSSLYPIMSKDNYLKSGKMFDLLTQKFKQPAIADLILSYGALTDRKSIEEDDDKMSSNDKHIVKESYDMIQKQIECGYHYGAGTYCFTFKGNNVIEGIVIALKSTYEYKIKILKKLYGETTMEDLKTDDDVNEFHEKIKAVKTWETRKYFDYIKKNYDNERDRKYVKEVADKCDILDHVAEYFINMYRNYKSWYNIDKKYYNEDPY
jgi:hypothetical protein